MSERKVGRNGGRRAVDGVTGVERVTVTLTPADREALRRLGGSAWIRRALRGAEDAARWDWLRKHTTEIAVGKTAMHIKVSTLVDVTDGALDGALDRLRG